MAKKVQEEEKLDVADYIDKFASWTEKNAKNIVIGFLGFTFAVAAFWGVSAMKTRALNTAANEVGIVNRRIDLLEKAIDKAKDKTTTEFKKSKESEIAKIHSEAIDVVSKYSDQSVTDFTSVRWASFLLNEEKDDMALEILNTAKPVGSRELSASGLFLKASILSRRDKTEEVVALYDQILEESSWKVFHAEALIQKGTLLQSEGDLDGAIALFDKAKNLNKDSGFSKDAAKYQRLLQLKKNHPEIFKTEG